VSKRSAIGSHVAVAGGLIKGGLGEADEVAAEVIQVFTGNPRGWAETPIDARSDEAFRQACVERQLPVFIHAPYLINFGSPSELTLQRSAAALAYSLRRAESIGATAVVLHAGSAVLGNRWDTAMEQTRAHLLPLLDDTCDDVRLLIEPTAGGGGALAADITSLAAYLDALADDRVGVCIDTCHLHAAGHDVSSPQAMKRELKALAGAVGPGRIGLVHVNDSRDQAGSKRDRHATLGEGTIGLEALGAMFASPVLRGVPMVVETPTHAQDVAALKLLRG
jgi:deoxyribonuclease IV